MRRLLALTLALSLCLPFAAAAENAGVNRTIDVEGTPIDSITVFPETSSDSENFSIHIALSGESAENVTNVEWTVQQCINSGCLLYTSPSPRDRSLSRMPSSA